MRLGSFVVNGKSSFGMVVGDGIVDLGARLQQPDLKSWLAAGESVPLELTRVAPDHSMKEVKWLAPIQQPTHLLGIGLNTKSHFEETAVLMQRKDGDYPAKPRLFSRSPLSLVAHGEPILVPRVSERLDYEGEIAIVIGKPGRYIRPEDALSHIAGYTCANDGSVRDYQKHSNQVTAGKNFTGSGSIGPWLLTSDEVPDPSALTLETRVNGEVRQRLVMSDLIFSFAELVSYISEIFSLQPGDTILTGSPAGIGALTKNWLRPGDTLEVEVSGVGVLKNAVIAEL